jgi:hypothetical protein
MRDIHELLVAEVDDVDPPTFPGLQQTFVKVRQRARLRRALTSTIALLVATAGILLAVRAFGGRPTDPAAEGQPNYEISARLVAPGEPIEGGQIRGEDFVWIRSEVHWDPTHEPGVHRCTWQVLDAQGNLVAERTKLYLPYDTSTPGYEASTMKMFPLTGEPADARGHCEPQRLDTPGIADLEPPPDMDDWDATVQELQRRVDEWAQRFQIHDMSADQLAGNMWAIHGAAREVALGNQEPSRLVELIMRRGTLCVLLPPEHEFRGGEFCDSSTTGSQASNTPPEQETQKDQLCAEARDMDGVLKSDQYAAMSEAEKDAFFLRAWEIAVQLKDLGYPSDVCDREAASEAGSGG